MRKLLNKPWFVIIVALGAIALVARVMLPNGVNPILRRPDSVPTAAAEGEPANTAPGANSALVTVEKMRISGPLRDPFAIRIKPDLTEKKPEPDFVETAHLSAIWTQNGETLVLINNHICQGGDEIGRLKIESATQDGVWITHWKGRDFISIGGSFTLSTPASKSLSAARSL